MGIFPFVPPFLSKSGKKLRGGKSCGAAEDKFINHRKDFFDFFKLFIRLSVRGKLGVENMEA